MSDRSYDDGCRCWNEGQWGRVHREDCPIHRRKTAAQMDLDAVRAVLKASGRHYGAVASCHDGPLPVQRLNGLQRRGYVRFAWGHWFVTAEGRDLLMTRERERRTEMEKAEWEKIRAERDKLVEQLRDAQEMNSHLGHKLAEADHKIRRLNNELRLLKGHDHE